VAKPVKTPADILHGVGLKRTPMRISILETLFHEKQPLSAPQILAKLARGTDNVTLYRTLKTFTQRKLLHRVRGEDQVWRYRVGEVDAAGHEHAHIVCDECGTVECLPDARLPDKAAKKAGVRSGYNVAYSEVLVHGTCPDCHS
jgi:Fur family ferric uptake transcriptional regulator